MNFNGVSIGSVVSATEDQFIALYQAVKPEKVTQDQCVELLKSAQAMATKDIEDLKRIGVAPQQIAKKLQNIVEKAKKVYESTQTSRRDNSFTLDFKRAIIDVEEDGSFRVSGFELREMRQQQCVLCGHEISGPATYHIENATTREEISLPELTLHIIEAHEYFAKPGNYRLDPSRICKVLELNK